MRNRIKNINKNIKIRSSSSKKRTSKKNKPKIKNAAKRVAIPTKLTLQKNLISDFKKTEEQLRDSEDRYRKLVELSLDGIAVHTEGKFVYANKAALDLIGAKSESEIIGKPILSIIHPDSIDVVKERLKQIDGGKTMPLIEEKFIRLEGTTIDVEVAAIPLIYNGKPSVQVIVRDISQRKLLETKLRETDIYYKTLVDASPEGISLIDLGGRIVFASSKLYEMYRLPENFKVIGTSIINWVHPDYHDVTFKRIKRFSIPKRGAASDEYKLVRYDKSIFWGQVTSTQILDSNGNVKAILSLTRDITDRKKAEESLHEREFWLKESQRVAQLGSYVLDFKTGYWTSSEVLDEIFGIEKSYERNVEGWAKLIHPEQRDEMLNYFGQIVKNKRLFEKEYRIVKSKDKSERWVMGLGELKFAEDGSPLTMFGTIQDVTERKRVQQEIIEAKEKAEKSDRLKTEFLAQMSHEIRTPINIIMNFATIIKEDQKVVMNDNLQTSFDIIESASKRIIRTIDLILNMSEIQIGTYEATFNFIDIYNNVLDKLYSEYKNNAEKKGLEFLLIRKTEDARIYSDEYSVIQIFANLLDNAVKYTDKGKIEILVKRDHSDKLIVEINDTGIGISENYLPDLFEPFAQEEQGYSRKFEGNGLGLALVKKYCEINNARIEVNSTKGIGSTFRVTFL